MARMLGKQDDNTEIYGAQQGQGFQFSAIRPDKLLESEYSLVTIVIDITGSVVDFADELLNMLKSAINGCKKSPKAENVLIRVVTFNNKITELHGFKPLSMIDVDKDYLPFSPDGMTALFDATYEAIEATLNYSNILGKKDYDCNGIIFIITDGMDNVSKASESMIKMSLNDAVKSEKIGALTTVLVGVNDATCRTDLDNFKNNADLTQFVSVGDATSQRLAKLAQFVSKSVSSTSQLIGTNQTTSLTF